MNESRLDDDLAVDSTAELADGGSDTAKGAAVGGVGGAALGAAVGATAGPVGAVIGAAIGGLAGAATGGAAGAAVDDARATGDLATTGNGGYGEDVDTGLGGVTTSAYDTHVPPRS